MHNNCSTLIQRKQNVLQATSRSNSDGKLQNGEMKSIQSLDLVTCHRRASEPFICRSRMPSNEVKSDHHSYILREASRRCAKFAFLQGMCTLSNESCETGRQAFANMSPIDEGRVEDGVDLTLGRQKYENGSGRKQQLNP